MKEGWTYKKIKDVGEVIGGTTPSTTNPEYWGGDICWISPAELHGEHYLYDSVKKITAKAVSAKSLKELPVGAVILSSRAPIGKIAINKVPMYCNQGFKCVVCGPELYNEFLYWWFYGKVDYLNSLGTGATFKEISKTVVENIVVPIAPLEEQKRIVERLDAAFENIDKLKANAEKQLAEAQTLFQKSLAKAMEPKEGWEEFSFGELIKLQSGDYLPSKYMINGKYPVYGGNGIAGYHNQYNRDGGKIVIGRVGALCGNVHYITTPFWLTDNGFEVILLKNIDIDFKYLSFYLNFLELGKYARQTAQPVISNASLKDVKLFLPSYTVQQRIVERLDALSENIRKYEEIQRQIISECDALKQALLRKVFE